jgi:hypothetical protein
MKEAPCIVEIVRLHSNAAGLSAGAVRYLKVEIEPDRFFWVRLIIAAHLVSPPFCVAHSRFVILIFARRDYGAVGALKRRPSPREIAVRERRQREWLSPKPNDSETGDGALPRI